MASIFSSKFIKKYIKAPLKLATININVTFKITNSLSAGKCLYLFFLLCVVLLTYRNHNTII